MSPKIPKVSGTLLLHGDEHVPVLDTESVAPPLGVTTTFRTPAPDFAHENLESDINFRLPDRQVYSRYSTTVTTRVEHILSKINEGHAISYASGLAAAYSALVFLKPKRIAISGGYHGFHVGIEVYKKSNPNVQIIDLEDEYQEGDISWVETPLNPTGESRNIRYYADKVHKVRGQLIVDSTFGPPPLQYPFRHGADVIMHSATKYFGGHSDLLAGLLVVKDKASWDELWSIRTFTGNVMGSLEAWLLLRSLKTYHLRIPAQVKIANQLVQWLHKISITSQGETFDGVPGGVIERVFHSSLQGKDSRGFEPSQQMTGGYPATFAIMMSNSEYAALLPFELRYWTPATSLGGVESLIEHRLRSDATSDPRLVRLSVGVEEFEDLRDDLKQALNALVKNGKSKL